MIDIKIFPNTQIKSLFPLENGCQMKGILPITVTHKGATTKLLQKIFQFFLILQNGILCGCAIERVVVIDEHGAFVLVLVKELSHGIDIVLT